MKDPEEIAREAAVLAEADDLAGLVELLVELRETAGRLRLVIGEVEALVAERAGRRAVIDGVALVDVERPRDRRNWRSEDLFRVVLRRIADPEGTGEIAVDPYELVGRLCAELPTVLGLGASTPWKAGGLRRLGLDPDEWCESRPGRPVVRIQPLA